MREIKFRAYIKTLKLTEPIEKINFDRKTVELRLTQCGYPDDLFEYDFGEIVLMQYTGLRDRNDIEVYEGYIIKSLYKTGYIKWNNEQARYNVYFNSKFGKNEMNFMKGMADECEVIGNIYENPELLEGE